ncbi:MAG: tRNA (N(6)-L-threonylcarbamoyladenosine(37)-C(2))-methylthiotransferase MtaB [Sedimentisphaerales bacterium]|nr:tRNA (N(6)-L-threonylcarbamoyladenosine(37)-C(2))-methylthiotransferase MtaB [Sedimentisphaerales bacterium]
MKTFATITLGCKVNQYESQQIRQLLEELGLRYINHTTGRPDLFIINTCCVTQTASAKSRRCIYKAKRQNPSAVIVVCGCLPAVDNDELNSVPNNNIHIIKHRESLAAKLFHIANRANISSLKADEVQNNYKNIKAKMFGQIKSENHNGNCPGFSNLKAFKSQTRSFLKIQDGCDGYCSYCIIPKARPDIYSKPPDEVLQEAESLVAAGHKEIVVTGIFLGAYGQKTVKRKNWPARKNEKLSELLDRMAQIPKLYRIRLSSLEPADITPRLLDTVCKSSNIMPHLHLSLQSGSDKILKRMCRQYDIEAFMQKVELIQAKLDRPAITTDLIVGFPGETDSDFEQTVSAANKAGFAKMHVFPFSPRKGTAAERFQDAVDQRVIKKRSAVLRNLGLELSYKFREQFIGSECKVLVESEDGQICGRCDRYFPVYIEKNTEKSTRGKIVRAKLVKNNENGAIGHLVQLSTRPRL